MGFPDDYTAIPDYNPFYTGPFGGNRGLADGPRYRALGNSMAVPVMRWIGERIQLVEAMA
jgi:DNA (cytosine-5)-methyltransferase 1